MNIEFMIGPSNEVQHDFIYAWLKENNYTIRGISYIGDHYSEIHCVGDYTKAYRKLGNLKHVSIESWE